MEKKKTVTLEILDFVCNFILPIEGLNFTCNSLLPFDNLYLQTFAVKNFSIVVINLELCPFTLHFSLIFSSFIRVSIFLEGSQMVCPWGLDPVYCIHACWTCMGNFCSDHIFLKTHKHTYVYV